MISRFRALALVSAFALVSCGGGGGGGSAGTGNTPSGPQPVAITETNAKPVAANALDAVVGSSTATDTVTGLPVGVQVNAAAGAGTSLQRIAGVARSAANQFAAANLPAGVTVNQTVGCAISGSVTIAGQVADSSGLTTGDSLTITMVNCVESAGTSSSGQLTMRVVSGSMTSLPFHVVLQLTATNLTDISGGTTLVTNGDIRLDWTATSETSQTLVATGASLSIRETASGATRTDTLRNYTQTLTVNGSIASAALAGTIETDSTRLGGTTSVTYTVTTPTAVAWDESTGVPTAGVIKVVGANNAQLLITINPGGSVSLQLDANGDGVFEKTITTTTTELAGLA